MYQIYLTIRIIYTTEFVRSHLHVMYSTDDWQLKLFKYIFSWLCVWDGCISILFSLVARYQVSRILAPLILHKLWCMPWRACMYIIALRLYFRHNSSSLSSLCRIAHRQWTRAVRDVSKCLLGISCLEILTNHDSFLILTDCVVTVKINLHMSKYSLNCKWPDSFYVIMF